MVFGAVKAILDLVDKFNEKKQHDEKSNNFDRVLTAIGNTCERSVFKISCKSIKHFHIFLATSEFRSGVKGF